MGLAVIPAWAQYSDMLAVKPGLRIGMSYMTQVDAQFSASAYSFGGDALAGEFDNGYVRDSAYAVGSQTWNWGFNDATQIQGGDRMRFASSSFSGPSTTVSAREGSPGVRIAWIPHVSTWGRRITFTSVASLDLRRMEVEGRTSLPASYEMMSKYYGHGGIEPTLLTLPYAGTYEGPGPLLDSFPLDTKVSASPDGAILRRYMSLDGYLVSLGAGGEMHLAITRRLSMFLQSQFLMNIYLGDFEYADSFELGGAFGLTQSSAGVSEVLFGISGGGGLHYDIGETTSLLLSVSKVLSKKLEGEEAGRSYQLGFNDGYLVLAGFQVEY